MTHAWVIAWFFTRNYLWSTAIWVRWMQFVLQGVVFGMVLAQLVDSVPNYQLYYIVGIIAIAIYNSGIIVGNELLSDAQYGVEDYLLAQPISRRALYFGRILEAGALGIAFAGVPAIAVLLTTGYFNFPSAALLLLVIAGTATGLAGLGLMLGAAFRQYEAFLVASNFINAFGARLSVAMYPLVAMPAIYAAIAKYNPISHVTWILHPSFGVAMESTPAMTEVGIVLLAWIIAVLIGGDLVFRHRLEGRRWE